MAATATAALLAERRAASTSAMAVDTRRRDPRAAPLTIRRNMTLDGDSCGSYNVADSITKCPNPRTCQDCLSKPGCMLTLYGSCVNASSLSHARDAVDASRAPRQATKNTTQPITAKPSGHTPVFFADNATYCGPSDAVCLSCLSKFKQIATSLATVQELDRQFCVGDGGCVCTGVCEVPAYREVETSRALCPSHWIHYHDPDGPSIPAFSSRHQDPRAPLLQSKIQSRNVEKTCQYHGQLDIQGCRRPRSAQSCLEQQSCMIWQSQCSSLDNYENKTDGFLVTGKLPFGTEAYYTKFPSNSTSVCRPSDAACGTCESSIAQFDANFSSVLEAGTCLGDGACLCEAYLEKVAAPYFSTTDRECGKASIREDETLIGIVTAIAVFGLGILAFLVWFRYRGGGRVTVANASRVAVSHVMRHMLDQVPANLQLDLFGWMRFQQQLRAQENKLLRGEEVDGDHLVPAAMEFEFAFIPTAPDFDEDENDSSAPAHNDPMALASAPVYRRRHHGGLNDEATTTNTRDQDGIAATAPPF